MVAQQNHVKADLVYDVLLLHRYEYSKSPCILGVRVRGKKASSQFVVVQGSGRQDDDSRVSVYRLTTCALCLRALNPQVATSVAYCMSFLFIHLSTGIRGPNISIELEHHATECSYIKNILLIRILHWQV